MLFRALVPLNTPLFVLCFFLFFFFSVTKTDQLLPRYPERKLHFRKKKRKKKDKSLPTPDFPRFPSNSTPLLLSSQLYSSQPVCLPLSAGFHGERHRGSAVPVRNYAP